MWGLILALLIAIIIAGFATLNSAPVSVNLLLWKAPEVSLAIVVLVSVLVGVLMGALFGTSQYLETMQRIRKLERRIRELETGEIKHEETKEQNLP